MPRTTGTYEGDAFLPLPLPPSKPPLLVDGGMRALLVAAEQACARLEVAVAIGPAWLDDVLARAQAIASCRIDGAEATLAESYADESGAARWLDALAHARKEWARRPTWKAVSGAHKRLFKGERAARPGELRRDEGRVDEAYVPPPPAALAAMTGALEAYWASPDALPASVRAGLALAQLELLQPCAAGNGRVAHLVMTLLLARPVPPLARYVERHRDEHRVRMAAIRTEGDWEGWTAFFLEAIRASSDEAVALGRDLAAIAAEDRARVAAAPKATVTAMRLVDALPRAPFVTASTVARDLDVAKPVAAKAVALLAELRVLAARKRDADFVYRGFVERLRGSIEP